VTRDCDVNSRDQKDSGTYQKYQQSEKTGICVGRSKLLISYFNRAQDGFEQVHYKSRDYHLLHKVQRFVKNCRSLLQG
jgi:hypothetical protein